MLEDRLEGQDAAGDSGGVGRWWVVSAVFLLALAGVLVWLMLSPGGSGSPRGVRPAVAGVRSPAVAPSASSRSAAGGCSLPAGEQSVPFSSPPAGVVWMQVGAMDVPQLPAVLGPQRSRGGWYTCFAHSPSGALLAAFSFWAEATFQPPVELARRLMVDAPPGAERADVRFGAGIEPLGYRYQSYTPALAAIWVVMQGPEGKQGMVLTTMAWSGGDWRFRFPAGGALPPFELVDDQTSYVPFGAVS